ncbi:methyl-accepting chemotaxis protein [Janthinobacterium sp. PAMC25594]|uniref:methyl-accepting chemotaxis protein n=1 Tax=Janthinobacterium sp. PAMC25594 TaxID=2861284 RepID=UPI001C62BFEB|nr:methyl-accepting chemotaxis protein [Janthinobacterium sp. PAMC25594]QYG08940.1 Tar ligand binding domain-containing protein [Janthinobacterium sp. PAMC25594]
MHTFKNLKIGTQLSLAFGLLTALILVMAAITLTGISSIGRAVNQIDKISVERLGPLYQAREALAQTGLAARNAYIFTDEIQANKELALVDEQKAIYLTALEKLMPVYGDDPEFAKVRTGLLAMSESLKRPRQLRETGNMKEFGNFLVNECSPLRRQIVSDMAVVVKKTQQQMDDATLLSASRADTSRQLSIIVAIVAFFISLLIAGFIKRILLKQLGGEPAYATEIANKIARGDLGISVDIKQDDKSSLLFAIKTMRDSLLSIVGQVREGTDSIRSASSEIASGNEDLASRTTLQSSSLEKIATAMEELTSTVKQNANNAHQANALAKLASSVSQQGGEVMVQVTETMESINDSSKKIVDIISVIDGIAFQTNILALNAAVEAARAGEQGRGFALVATEVRNLAQRSAAAAKEIKTLINDSVNKVGSGSALVQKAGTTMQEVVVSVQRVREIMGEISVASAEQSSGIEEVNGAIGQMDSMTQQNTALVEEASSAALELREQASSLADVVGLFKLERRESATRQSGHTQATKLVPMRLAHD